MALISKPVAASAATARDAYAMASEFAINATDKESLMAAAKEAGYATAEANSIAPGARAIAGIRDAGEIVGWAYRSEQGEVSTPFSRQTSTLWPISTQANRTGSLPWPTSKRRCVKAP